MQRRHAVGDRRLSEVAAMSPRSELAEDRLTVDAAKHAKGPRPKLIAASRACLRLDCLALAVGREHRGAVLADEVVPFLWGEIAALFLEANAGPACRRQADDRHLARAADVIVERLVVLGGAADPSSAMDPDHHAARGIIGDEDVKPQGTDRSVDHHIGRSELRRSLGEVRSAL